MRKKLDKVFTKAKCKHRVYQPRLCKKAKKSWWQSLYSLFFWF